MRKIYVTLIILSVLLTAVACSAGDHELEPNQNFSGTDYNPGAMNTGEDRSNGTDQFRRIVINGGPMVEDYGAGMYRMNVSRNEIKEDPTSFQEQKIENIPDVQDAAVVYFSDNILVGIRTNENLGTISKRIMLEMGEEAKYNQIYITSDGALFKQIETMQTRMEKGERVSQNELRQLLAAVSQQVIPNNYKY